MAEPPTTADTEPPANEIDASFMAERSKFWSGFTGAATYATVAIAVLLVCMWIFLV